MALPEPTATRTGHTTIAPGSLPFFAPASRALPGPPGIRSIGPVRHAPRPETRIATGVKRLDQLLGGGYPAGAALLLYGPAFCGKQQLQHQAFVRSATHGIPATFILHAASAGAISDRLNRIDPAFGPAEEAGMVSYIDVYSHFLGEPEDHPNATYIQDPLDLPGTLAAFDQQRQKSFANGPQLVAMESMSTMLMDAGPSKTFAFVRALLGRTVHRGGLALMCLEADMHPEQDVQMAKHFSTGILELRRKGDTRMLRVEGLETPFPRAGWVEYDFTDHTFELTGGFMAKSIR